MSAMDTTELNTDCSNDLMLLDRVFLRLGNADSDEQLENCLNKFLCPVILKLSSPHEQVRTRVMELLVHVNKRVKCRSGVKMPVASLLQQYKEPNANTFIINFAIIYITLGYPRLTREEQLNLAPAMMEALLNKPQAHQDSIMILLMPLLGEMNEKEINLKEKPEIANLVLKFANEILLLPYRALPSTSDEDSEFQVPPGMSMKSYKRIVAKNTFDVNQLEEMKLSILNFLNKDILKVNDTLLPLIVAAADSRFSVANDAGSPLSRASSSVDWSSPAVGAPLFSLYLGSWGPKLPPIDDRRTPACTRLRLKLLQYINKLTGPAILFPHCVQVIFTSLFDENSNARLRNLALTFLLNVVNFGVEKQLKLVAEVLLKGLLKLVRNPEYSEHHSRAYMGIGRLAMKVPASLSGQFTVLEELMNKVIEAPPELKTSLRDALLDMAHAFKLTDIKPTVSNGETASEANKMEVDELSTVNSDNKGAQIDEMQAKTMVVLIDQYLNHNETIVRYIATRYAAVVFPDDYIPAKYLLLLAGGDTQDEIANEALKCLYGTARLNEITELINNTSFESLDKKPSTEIKKHTIPAFGDMVEYVWSEMENRKKSSNSKYRFVVNNQVLQFHPLVYQGILRYLRMCLNHSAGLKDCSDHPNDSSPLLGQYIKNNLLGSTVMEHYLSLITILMNASPEFMPLACFLDIIGCVPERFASIYTSQLQFLQTLFTTSTKEDIRETSATIYSIITANTMEKSNIDRQILEFVNLASGKDLEAQCGYVSAFSNLCERCIALSKKENKKFGGKGFSVLDWQPYKSASQCLANLLLGTQNIVVGIACSKIALLGKSSPLPFPNSLPEQESIINSDEPLNFSKNNEKIDDTAMTSKFSIVERLFGVVNNVKFSSKIRENAIYSLGAICCGERFPYSKHVVRGFLEMAKETKEFEIHLAIGEALVMCVEGVNSSINRDAWCELKTTDVKDVSALEESNVLLETTINQLLKLAREPHPHSKQATSVWLLALLKNCFARDPIRNNLAILQNTFMDYLSENSEIVQDVGSKGLSLVYQYSPEDKQKQLVGDIIEQLTSGKRAVSQVTQETKVFEEGELGQSPTGGNLSTYKELCSLASDLNQPDLLYKFMHLAHHNSVWNSKKGAAFGFQSLALNAGEQLSEHLPRIIPRLYRYRFDPTPKIQNSMTSIWHALVPETQKTVQKYYKEILEDLITNLTSGQWRVRISCCHALADLLRDSGKLAECVDNLPELWNQLFRVMDDVHEQTRLAAQSTANTLSKICIRASDVEAGKDGKALVAAVLPVLLETGITHLVKEVRTISLVTVSKLVDSCGASMKPWIPALVVSLVSAAGELETSTLSYYSAALAGSSQIQRALDTARAAAATSHYTVATCVKCMPYIDIDILNETLPKMLELTKVPQLGTKVACCHFFVILSHHMREQLEPVAGKIMAALLNGTLDRNVVVRKAFCEALGEVAAYAKTSSIEKLMNKLLSWYESKDDEHSRLAIAYTLKSICKCKCELLKDNAEIIAPMIFLEMHKPKIDGASETENSTDLMTEVWTETCGTKGAGVRMYRKELIKTTTNKLSNARGWGDRLQAAKAICTIAEESPDGLGEDRVKIIKVLLDSIRGKTFDGKHHLLNALAKLCMVVPGEQAITRTLADDCITAIIGECRKQNDLVYKKHALIALADMLEALKFDKFDQAYELIKDILEKDESSIQKDSDDEDNSGLKDRREQLSALKQTAYQLISRAWPQDAHTQEKYQCILIDHCAHALYNGSRTSQLGALSAANAVLDKLQVLKNKPVTNMEIVTHIVNKSTEMIQYTFKSGMQTRYKREALNLMYLLMNRLKDLNCPNEMIKLKSTFDAYYEELSKDISYEVSTKLDDIKKIIK